MILSAVHAGQKRKKKKKKKYKQYLNPLGSLTAQRDKLDMCF
jgi:hypothetical protein